MTQFSQAFTITKKDNLRYNFFLMRKKLIATSALVFVIIAAMIGLLKYAQGASISLALINAFVMAVVGTLILIGINPFFQQVVRGVIIVVAVLANISASRRSALIAKKR